MIVQIHKSSASTAGTMRYNGDKVRAGVAEVVTEHGIGSKDVRVIARTLADRELLSLREAQHVSFQMSVNPGPDDAVRDDQIPALVRDLMDGLGYGRQPWAVFRHEDTGRRHWHVVSVRVDDKGKKINDYWEKRRCDRLVTELGPKYGFTKGAAKKEARQPAEAASPMPVFRKNGGETLRMIEACVVHSLSYRFTTRRQFAEILRCHGVQVQEGLGRDDLKVYLSFQGLDGKGRACTGAVSGARLPFDVAEALSAKIAESLGDDSTKEKAAVRAEINAELRRSPDYESFEERMKEKGVDIVIYRDAEGRPSAATVIDHRTKRAFKASELSRTLSADILSLAAGKNAEPAKEEARLPDDGKEETESKEEKDIFNAAESAITSALSAAFTFLSSGGSGDIRENRKKKDNKKKQMRI